MVRRPVAAQVAQTSRRKHQQECEFQSVLRHILLRMPPPPPPILFVFTFTVRFRVRSIVLFIPLAILSFLFMHFIGANFIATSSGNPTPRP